MITDHHFPHYPATLMWFRRDLRDYDNAALFYALKHSQATHCVFVFDQAILGQLPSKSDRRVEFIWESVRELAEALRAKGGELQVLFDHAVTAIPALAARLGVKAVFINTDYEPDAVARDAQVGAALAREGIALHGCKDTVIFEKSEVLTLAGGTFSVFTPYKNAWLKKVNPYYLKAYPVISYIKRLARALEPTSLPSLAAMGFERTNLAALGIKSGMSGAAALLADFVPRMADYKVARDFPAVKGVSYLSVHNRFGTCSVRELANAARQHSNLGSGTWLSELIWRDFYFQIIHHAPYAAQSAYKKAYDGLAWENSETRFAAWCEGRTGYPIVDAAQRQLNQTGFMHNRLRMITASFLTKDLLIDWRWGERYFAAHLNDFDLSANNGGWQWAASTGCDAQPYFRIFNPITQSERFDATGKFIRRYVTELKNIPDQYIHAPWLLPPLSQQALGVVIGKDYPAPIVDHAVQRDLALALYKAARGDAEAPLP